MSAESDTRDSGPLASPHAGNEATVQPDGPLILVVDDDPMNRLVMSAMLRKLKYRFHLATNGREAVDAIRRESYAAVLMDCLMPEMDGYEATALTRQYEREHQVPGVRRHLPIIAVTAVAIQGARARCIEAGMDDFLSKPVVTESVAGVLERWVTGSGSDATWTPELAAHRAEPEDEPIDRRALDALRELDPEGGATLIAEVVHDFRTEVSRRFLDMRTAAANGEMSTLTQELHFVAGCASLVGATHVERLARSLETVDPRDAMIGPRGAEELVDRLEQAFTRARIILESIVASSSTAEEPPPDE